MFDVSIWSFRVSIVSVIVSVYGVYIVNNMLKIRLLYKFSVGCQYILRFSYLLSFLNCMIFGVVWGFDQSLALFGLMIGENGDEANTS